MGKIIKSKNISAKKVALKPPANTGGKSVMQGAKKTGGGGTGKGSSRVGKGC